MNRPIPTNFSHNMLNKIAEIGELASYLIGRKVSFSISSRRVMELGVKTALAMSKEEFIEHFKDRS